MTDTPFIKFYPGDFLGGTSGLSPAERGVYITLLCLMYEADGPIARDDARLARRCGSPKAAFIRILDALIDVGKITQDGDTLSNRRAEKALMDRTNRTQNAAYAAKERWSAPAKKSEQNQRQEDAGAMPEQCVADAKPEARSQSITDTSVSVGNTTPKRGSRLSQNWVLPREWGEWALAEGWPDEVIRQEAEKFRDFWTAKSGRDAAKLDWQATWRNWMRNSRAKQSIPSQKETGAQHARRIAELATRGMDFGPGQGDVVPLLPAGQSAGRGGYGAG